MSPFAARQGRLIIVSNRLPVSINDNGKSKFELKTSSGGLVTGLRGLANSGVEFLWFGWPGLEVAKKDASSLKSTLREEHNAIPVMLDQHTSDRFYNGFSSMHPINPTTRKHTDVAITDSTIWPLFHYQLDKVTFDDGAMLAYRKANKIFADTIMPHLEDGDHIWVHDYHLMLLPLMVRQRAERMSINITIGWFLHTTFPSSDFLDVLPSRRDILDGILGADLVGFQTDQARTNFLNACSQTLYVKSCPTRHPIKVLTVSQKMVVDRHRHPLWRS